ncbi:MAG: hypothetical protein JSW35_11355 [Deltaproteobacteria bacterium]|nr:MAG: hypothetical protein JSW35_11355 [Deltaproteobacteria bacterium]
MGSWFYLAVFIKKMALVGTTGKLQIGSQTMKISKSYEIFSDVSFIFVTEKHRIDRILEVTDGNRTRSAKPLATALTALQRKLRVFAESTIRRK